MIILKKDFNLKALLLASVVFAFVIFLDATFSSSDADHFQEARFLGIGKKTTYGPCEDGSSKATITFTIFWIPISSSEGLIGC